MTIESPCIRVCTLDATGEVCMGCFRTLEEIGLWASLADAERERVLARLPGRRRTLEAARRGGTSTFCERCGTEFRCGASDTSRPCWCTTLPAISPAGPGSTCLCPACLAAAAIP